MMEGQENRLMPIKKANKYPTLCAASRKPAHRGSTRAHESGHIPGGRKSGASDQISEYLFRFCGAVRTQVALRSAMRGPTFSTAINWTFSHTVSLLRGVCHIIFESITHKHGLSVCLLTSTEITGLRDFSRFEKAGRAFGS